MPRLPIDYSRSLIYKLCCNDTDVKEEYVGSTTDFTKRKNSHKNHCNNPNTKEYRYNLKVYQYIREYGGFENWSMIQIEKFPCESKRELETRERYWIETLESKLNSSIPTRTQKEYYIENADKLKENMKEYRIENADKLKEINRQYYIENAYKIKENNKEYYIENVDKIKEKNKKYYIENADKIKKINRQYYIENADKLKEKQKEYSIENANKIKEYMKEYRIENANKIKEKITCECCSQVNKNCLAKHRKTNKHLKLLEEKLK